MQITGVPRQWMRSHRSCFSEHEWSGRLSPVSMQRQCKKVRLHAGNVKHVDMPMAFTLLQGAQTRALAVMPDVSGHRHKLPRRMLSLFIPRQRVSRQRSSGAAAPRQHRNAVLLLVRTRGNAHPLGDQHLYRSISALQPPRLRAPHFDAKTKPASSGCDA